MISHPGLLGPSSSDVPTSVSTEPNRNISGLTLRRLSLVVMLAGVAVGLQVMRFFPAPPVFSERLGRITNLQSYENNYFASLRSFTQKITRTLNSGRIPVIVLGDFDLPRHRRYRQRRLDGSLAAISRAHRSCAGGNQFFPKRRRSHRAVSLLPLVPRIPPSHIRPAMALYE